MYSCSLLSRHNVALLLFRGFRRGLFKAKFEDRFFFDVETSLVYFLTYQKLYNLFGFPRTAVSVICLSIFLLAQLIG